MKKIFYLLLVISCTSVQTPSDKITTDEKLSENEGMVIGSISIKNNHHLKKEYSFYFEKIDSEKRNLKDKITIVPTNFASTKMKPDFFDGDYGIYFFKIKKPQGQYKFYAVEYKQVSITNYGVGDRSEIETYSLPFNIEKAKTTYIGELSFNNVPLYINNGFILDKRSERDLPQIKLKFPTINIE